MKNKTIILVLLLVGVPLVYSSEYLGDTDHMGNVLNITEDSNISGHHYNISTFYQNPNVTLTIQAYNGSSTSGYARINTTGVAYIYGQIIGDGRGHGGGSGGTGGSGADSVDGTPSKSGPTGTDQNATNGASGQAGETNAGGDGGVGGKGSITPQTGGSGGAGSESNEDAGNGGIGTSASANSDQTVAINVSRGEGGGGGGGGGGGDRQSGLDGGGGGGGGRGQDGGASLIIVAKNKIVTNASASLNLRAGQNASCATNAQNGEDGQGGEPTGGKGAFNDIQNCGRSGGGNGGDSDATGGIGGDGGTGGYGSGGGIVFVSYDLNLSGLIANVSGGDNTATYGGTIKVLYTNSVQENGSYDGENTLVYSTFTDDWFVVEQKGPTLTAPTNKSVVYTNANVTWQTNVTDANSDLSNVTFYHSVDGTFLFNQTFENIASGTQLNSTLYYGNYTQWQNVSVIVEATDGESYGTNQTGWINVTNREPAITSFFNRNGTNVNYTLFWVTNYTLGDGDGDSLSFFRNLTVNGTQNNSFTNSSLSNNTLLSQNYQIDLTMIQQYVNISYNISDGFVKTQQEKLWVFVVDQIIPSASCTLNQSIGVVQDQFTINCTISEVSGIVDHPLLHIEDSNGPVINSPFNMTLLSTNTTHERWSYGYTPQFSGETYDIVRIDMTDEASTQNTNQQTLSLSYTSTTDTGEEGSGSGGGGGSFSTTSGSLGIFPFTIDPEEEKVIARIGATEREEFQVRNQLPTPIFLNISINEELSDEEVLPWVVFGGDGDTQVVNLPVGSGSGLDPGAVFVEYRISIPENLTEDEATSYFLVVDVARGNDVAQHIVVVDVRDSFFSNILAVLDNQLYARSFDLCGLSSEPSESCIFNFRVSVGTILVGILIIFVVLVVLQIRDRGKL